MSRLKRILLLGLLGVFVTLGLFGCTIDKVDPKPKPPIDKKYEVSLVGEAMLEGAKLGSGYAQTINTSGVILPDWNINIAVLTKDKKTLTYKFIIKNGGEETVAINMSRPTNIPESISFDGGVITGGSAENNPQFAKELGGKDSVSIANGETKVLLYTLRLVALNRDVPQTNLNFQLVIE